jgi:hypothetical protein
MVITFGNFFSENPGYSEDAGTVGEIECAGPIQYAALFARIMTNIFNDPMVRKIFLDNFSKR